MGEPYEENPLLLPHSCGVLPQKLGAGGRFEIHSKAIASQNLIIAIQAISTKWEKPARGGANAVLRNRVPEALKVPEFSASDVPVSYMIHLFQHHVVNDTAMRRGRHKTPASRGSEQSFPVPRPPGSQC